MQIFSSKKRNKESIHQTNKKKKGKPKKAKKKKKAAKQKQLDEFKMKHIKKLSKSFLKNSNNPYNLNKKPSKIKYLSKVKPSDLSFKNVKNIKI